MKLRKTLVFKETILTDEGAVDCDPVVRAVALAVVRNPYAGRSGAALEDFFDTGGLLGERLMGEAVALLDRPAISYGKAAIVGMAGEMEHGAALVHPRLGAPMRAAVGGGKSLIPANVKVAALGQPIDVPLGHKDDPWAFDYIDTVTVMVADAPRADEIVVAMAVADGPRANPRVGKGPTAK